jgi:type I restriction enzyme S subunit
MSVERLLALYEDVADAPEAIPRLRRFVLDLAVHGKLVPQDRSDEAAPELLKRIAAERIDQTGLPTAWRRARVGTILEFQYGKGLKASDRVDEGPIPVFGSNGIIGFTREPLTVHPAIIVGRKGSAGALQLCDGASWTTDVAYFVECPSFFAIRFLYHALAILDLDRLGKGVKPGLSRSDAYEQVLCIPPLAEQHRIVAKVDELMALCDRLEAARTEREATRDGFTAAGLARLSAPDPNTFRDDACFALDALPALTARVDQIKQLRKTVLNLAIRGKLVSQDPKDEPASKLLQRIAAERARLVKAGKIRKEKALRAISERELPFDLPNGWAWTRLGSLVHLVSGQHLQPSEYSADSKAGLPYITGPSDFGTGGLQISRFAIVRKAVAKKGQLLLTVKGSVGKTATCDIAEVAISRQLMALTAIAWNDRFLVLITHRLAEKLQEEARSLIPGISRKDVEEFVFPLPPLAEQNRIVAKVDELMRLCDHLETSLTTADDTRRRLLDAILAEALAPAADRELEAAE